MRPPSSSGAALAQSVAVALRSQVEEVRELPGEIALVTEAALQRDLGDRFLGGKQQARRGLDPDPVDEFRRRDLEQLDEALAELALRKAGDPRQFRDFERGAVVLLDIGDDFGELAITLGQQV